MKKEKKVENESKKVTKDVKKGASNNVVFSNDMKKGIKIIAMILAFIATLACIFIFVFSIITSLNVVNTTKTELLHDNFSVTFISNLNLMSVTEAENIIEGYGSKTLFIIFDIVIPAIASICVLILLIIFAKKAMDFVNSVNREKDLFTESKLHAVQQIAFIAESILTITFIIFNRPSLLLYIFTSGLIFIVISLFKKCVEYKNNH